MYFYFRHVNDFEISGPFYNFFRTRIEALKRLDNAEAGSMANHCGDHAYGLPCDDLGFTRFVQNERQRIVIQFSTLELMNNLPLATAYTERMYGRIQKVRSALESVIIYCPIFKKQSAFEILIYKTFSV